MLVTPKCALPLKIRREFFITLSSKLVTPKCSLPLKRITIGILCLLFIVYLKISLSGDILFKFFINISIYISYISMWEHVPNRTSERSGLFLIKQLILTQAKIIMNSHRRIYNSVYIVIKNALSTIVKWPTTLA